jgi:hypothetical protein
MAEPNGPVVHVPGDVAVMSRLLGIPVVSDDGFTHAPECYWCKGEANSDTCPRSIRMREQVRELFEPVAVKEGE